MKQNNYSTIIDFGSDNLRLSVFNRDSKNIFSSSQQIVDKNNFEEHSKTLNFLIRNTEKKIASHLESIVVLYDNKDFFSVDISIKKTFDQPILFKDIYFSLIREANLLIINNYVKDKIIHLVPIKYIIDGKDYFKKIKDEDKLNSIVIEIKFICINWNIYNKILNIFKNNNLQILNMYCSSYVKFFSYINSFKEYNYLTFLDIGWERSTIISYNKNQPIYFNTIPIGGNHVTKDISKILNLNLSDSEKIKKSFNKSEIEFSFYQENLEGKKNLIKEIIGKDISTDLLRKVVLARVEEIINLAFKDMPFSKDLNNSPNSTLVLTGNGSHLFNENSFHLNIEYDFKEISFYEESDSEICNAGYFYNRIESQEMKFIKKNNKKTGFFEKFFNLFSK